jgi:hypothetical protein
MNVLSVNSGGTNVWETQYLEMENVPIHNNDTDDTILTTVQAVTREEHCAETNYLL